MERTEENNATKIDLRMWAKYSRKWTAKSYKLKSQNAQRLLNAK